MKFDKELLTTSLIITGILLLIFGGIYYFKSYNDKRNASTAAGANDSTHFDLNDVANGTPAPTSSTTMPTGQSQFTELIKEDTQIGTGAEAKPGDKLTVHYTGKLLDGTVFDSSVTRGEPLQFVLGQGNVIQGWDQGIEGMKEGGKRTLKIPYSLAYGEYGAPPTIPGRSDLIFDVELIKVN